MNVFDIQIMLLGLRVGLGLNLARWYRTKRPGAHAVCYQRCCAWRVWWLGLHLYGDFQWMGR